MSDQFPSTAVMPIIMGLVRVITLCVVLLVAACSPQPNTEAKTPANSDQSVQDERAIRDVLDRIAHAWNTSDIDAFLAEFTEDMIVDPPNGPAVYGRDANRRFAKPLIENGENNLLFDLKEVVIAGDWAFVRSAFTGTIRDRNSGKLQDMKNSVVHTLERQADRAWKVRFDIFNTDMVSEQNN